ncbi:hypothetical protein [Streptomyces sp. NPDC052701]|uniref:hypothetical protein n=1 Tax=Streptomyces sp. NPDC052701 TaxID=3155533 RepID=UPI0034298E0E
MSKLKKAVAVAVMVGGMALGGGIAHADDGHDYKYEYKYEYKYKYKYDNKDYFYLGNLQAVECDQDFNGGVAFAPVQVTGTGDNTQVIGNFCAVVGPDGD